MQIAARTAKRRKTLISIVDILSHKGRFPPSCHTSFANKYFTSKAHFFAIIPDMRKNVLFIIPRTSHVVDAKFAGVHEYAQKRSWNVRRVASDQIPIEDLLECWHPDGIIADSLAFASASVPSVLIDVFRKADSDRFPRVNLDLSKSAELAGMEFLRLGLSSVAWLPPLEEHAWSDERRDHFLSFAKRHGLTVSIFPKRARRESENRDYADRLVAWAKSLPRPCGVFAANDQNADLFLTVCAIAGIKVPADLAVISVDDSKELCETTTPPLTSLTPPFRACGYAAAEMLDALMKGNETVPDRLLDAIGITRRDSTRRIYGQLTDIRKAQELIRRRACDGLKSNEVCAILSGGLRSAQIRFRAATGHTIREEIQSTRMAKARELLQTTRKPISEIAALCGYETDSFLCEAFKRATGQTMGSWRKKHLYAAGESELRRRDFRSDASRTASWNGTARASSRSSVSYSDIGSRVPAKNVNDG